MKKKIKKALALILALVMIASIVACGTGTEDDSSDPVNTPAPTDPSTPATPSPEHPADMTIEQRLALMNTATHSSEIPDWTGPQLTLRVWQGAGTGDPTRVLAGNDVISAEITRVTGITIDSSGSFDNAGMDQESVVAVRAATGDFPEIAYNVGTNTDLVRGDVLYDLTDLIPLYAPIAYERITTMAPNFWEQGHEFTGRHYQVRNSWWPQTQDEQRHISELLGVNNIEQDRLNRIQGAQDTMGWVSVLWVRDDVLKLVYPNAKSQDEIEAMFAAQGHFTREQVYDIPITSKDDFFDFLYKIRDAIDEHDINVGGRPVYPTYVNQGGDNWALGSFLIGVLNGLRDWNYFTEFDLTQRRIVIGYEQDFFRDDMRRIARFVRDGITPASNLIEDGDTFRNRLDNGEFVVTYSGDGMRPNPEALEAAGHDFKYRTLFLDIPQNTTRRVLGNFENGGHMGISIFKDKVAEEDVPQVLMWINFLMSASGMDLLSWGPESAGLWEWQADGSRKFTDPALEDALVYRTDASVIENYNLISHEGGFNRHFPGIYPGIMLGGVFSPRYQSNNMDDRNPNDWHTAFRTGIFDDPVYSRVPFSAGLDIWFFFHIPDVQRYWDVWGSGFEPLMTRSLAANSDEEFDRLFDNMLRFGRENGLDENAVDEINAFFQETFPETWEAMLQGN